MMQMTVGPAQGGLQDRMKPAKVGVAGHQQTPPDDRLGTEQDNFQLVSWRGGLRRARFHIGNHELFMPFLLMRSNNFSAGSSAGSCGTSLPAKARESIRNFRVSHSASFPSVGMAASVCPEYGGVNSGFDGCHEYFKRFQRQRKRRTVRQPQRGFLHKSLADSLWRFNLCLALATLMTQV